MPDFLRIKTIWEIPQNTKPNPVWLNKTVRQKIIALSHSPDKLHPWPLKRSKHFRQARKSGSWRSFGKICASTTRRQAYLYIQRMLNERLIRNNIRGFDLVNTLGGPSYRSFNFRRVSFWSASTFCRMVSNISGRQWCNSIFLHPKKIMLSPKQLCCRLLEKPSFVEQVRGEHGE